jgi:hypothetical protein
LEEVMKNRYSKNAKSLKKLLNKLILNEISEGF